jgi:TldD protein
LKDILIRVINVGAEKFGADYVEIRAQELFKTMLTLKEGRVEAAKQGIERGAALRVLVDGAWGFASVGGLDAEILNSAVSDACRMAKAASLRTKTPIELVETEAVEAKIALRPQKTRRKFTLKTK